MLQTGLECNLQTHAHKQTWCCFGFKHHTEFPITLFQSLSVQSGECAFSFKVPVITEPEHIHSCIVGFLPTSLAASLAQLDVVAWGGYIEQPVAVRATDLHDMMMRDQRCPVSPITNNPMYSNTLSLCLFRADTITDAASICVPYLKLINAASDLGGHQEVFNPSHRLPSTALLPSAALKNIINLGIYGGLK